MVGGRCLGAGCGFVFGGALLVGVFGFGEWPFVARGRFSSSKQLSDRPGILRSPLALAFVAALPRVLCRLAPALALRCRLFVVLILFDDPADWSHSVGGQRIGHVSPGLPVVNVTFG